MTPLSCFLVLIPPAKPASAPIRPVAKSTPPLRLLSAFSVPSVAKSPLTLLRRACRVAQEKSPHFLSDSGLTPLFTALTNFPLLSPLVTALPKTKDLKSFIYRTYEKTSAATRGFCSLFAVRPSIPNPKGANHVSSPVTQVQIRPVSFCCRRIFPL